MTNTIAFKWAAAAYFALSHKIEYLLLIFILWQSNRFIFKNQALMLLLHHMEFILMIIFIIAFLYAVILHEIAHGWTANYFGDDTAKVAGRLSLNPLVHIDPIGSILVPLFLIVSQAGFLFGWAKPVPVNPYRLKGTNTSYRWVASAGIITNLSLAVISALVLKITTQMLGLDISNLGVIFFVQFFKINVILAVFNAMPLPGFDGFNFLTTFSGFVEIIKKTPLSNPLFMARYGLMLAILVLFLFMPVISWIFNFVFNIFVSIFGLYF